MAFRKFIAESKMILTEGGMVERIRRNPAVNLDPFIAHSGLVYNEYGRNLLKKIYHEYIGIGQKHNLPFIALAPTWRANPDRISKSAFSKQKNINQDCVDFLNEIRRSYGDYSKLIMVGGIMGCKGDAYCPEEALSIKDATLFHGEQANALANSDLDFIKVATLPAVSEALGMASAISVHKIPYILSFVVRADGTVLDGTPFYKAIELIDSEIAVKPIFYMVNCVHPTIFNKAIVQNLKASPNIMDRVLGLQANTSSKSPEELDNLAFLDTTHPKKFAGLMIDLHHQFGVKILGGCCGSDGRHIAEIAKTISLP